MPKTIEELEAELAQSQAAQTAAQARISELNNESKGHRLNADNFRSQAEKAKSEADAALKATEDRIAAANKAKEDAEAKAAQVLKEAEEKSAEATRKAQERAVNADLKVTAKDAGAHDVADILALLDRSKIKLDANGDIENAADLIADLKKTKPHLFGTPSTSNPAPAPAPKPAGAKHAKDMTDEEFEAARRSRAWRK